MTDIILDNPNENNPIIRALYADSQATVSIYGYASSYPYVADPLIQPLHDWFNELYSHPLNSLVINFSIPFFATESYIEHFIRILEKADEGQKKGKTVIVNWYYSFMNGDELEDHDEYLYGKYFKDYKSWSFTFNLIPFSSYSSLDSAEWPGFAEYMKPNQYE